MTGRTICGVLGLLVVLAVAAIAQVHVGDAVEMNLNGVAQFGYSADYSNNSGSDHSVDLGGSGNLSGNYHSPNFMSFTAAPFFNRSRTNSTYQSISNASGVISAVNLFSAGFFPGSISYDKTYNGSGRYSVPGVADYVTHGNNDTLGVSWSARVPKTPQVTFSFSRGHSNSSIYGSDEENSSLFRNISVNSSYRLSGFDLSGNYRNYDNTSNIPDLTLDLNTTSHSHGQSYGFNMSHSLPFSGALTGSATHTTSRSISDYSDYQNSVNSFSSGVGFTPLPDLNIGANAYYTDNLIGTIQQQIAETGGVISNSDQQGSHGTDVTSFAGYTIRPLHVMLMGTATYRTQSYFGKSLTSKNYSGMASYGWYVARGFFNASATFVRSQIDTQKQSSNSVNSSVSYTRKIQAWEVTGNFNYSQNTQTTLLSYTTNGIGFSGSISRKLPRGLRWSAGAYGSRNGLTSDARSENRARSYTTSFGTYWLSASASYSHSEGNAIQTASGLSTVPITGGVVDGSAIVRYNGDGWSFGLTTNPTGHLTASESFSKSLSSTMSSSINRNHNEQFNSIVQYQVRRVYVTGGFTRLLQGVGVTASQPTIVNSYYIGLSRWFNIF